MRKIVTLFFFVLVGVCNAQTNQIPDGSFEEGVIDGANHAYYKVNWKTTWRIWPHMRFDYESENVNSGNRALRLSHEVYTNADNFAPTFRCEVFSALGKSRKGM